MPPPCPDCSTELVSEDGFGEWCPACRYGLVLQPDRDLTRRQRLTGRAHHRFAERMYADVLHRPDTGKCTRVVTLVVACVVHATTAVVPVIGVLALYPGYGFAWWVRFTVALLALLLLIEVQPLRLPRRLKPLAGLNRETAPTLFGVLERVAAVVGATVPQTVGISTEFNASYNRVTRRQPRLVLGMALWSVIDWPERVVLLGHELAHDVNGDARRGRTVHLALFTLHRWRRLLAPDLYRGRPGGAVGLAYGPAL